MTTIRKINVSQVEGRNPFYGDSEAILPSGTLVMYDDDNGGFKLRVHDGVTEGGNDIIPNVVSAFANDAGYLTSTPGFTFNEGASELGVTANVFDFGDGKTIDMQNSSILVTGANFTGTIATDTGVNIGTTRIREQFIEFQGTSQLSLPLDGSSSQFAIDIIGKDTVSGEFVSGGVDTLTIQMGAITNFTTDFAYYDQGTGNSYFVTNVVDNGAEEYTLTIPGFDFTNLTLPGESVTLIDTATNTDPHEIRIDSAGNATGIRGLYGLADISTQGTDQQLYIVSTATGVGTTTNVSYVYSSVVGANATYFARHDFGTANLILAETTSMSGGAVLDSADGNFEVRGVTNVNAEASGVVNIVTDAQGAGHSWQFGDNGNLTVPASSDIAGLSSITVSDNESLAVNLTSLEEGPRTVLITQFGLRADNVITIATTNNHQILLNEIDKEVSIGNIPAGKNFRIRYGTSAPGGLDNGDVEIDSGNWAPGLESSVYLTAQNNTWKFRGEDSAIVFPDTTVQTTAWAGGRVVSVPTSSVGATGDKTGDLAFNGSYIYYCTTDFIEPTVYSTTLSLDATNTTTFYVPTADVPEDPTGGIITISGIVIKNIISATVIGSDWELVCDGGNSSAGAGSSVTVATAGSGDIWKRTQWGTDTW